MTRPTSFTLQDNPEGTGGGVGKLANFNRWVALWRYRLGPHGEMTTANEVMNQIKKDGLLNNTTRNLLSCDSPDDNSIFWTNLGPFNSQGALGSANGSNHCSGYQANKQNQGRIESISVNPNIPDDIVIGAYNGGIWRTEDGGMSWTNTTDDEGFSLYGIHSLVRHPADPKIIYATTSVGGNLWEESGRDIYGIGVIMSTDWGDTWQTTGLSYQNFPQLGQLAIDPNSTLSNTILFVCSRTDIYKWQGNYLATGTWNSVYSDIQWSLGSLWYEYVNNADIECASNGDAWFSNYKGIFKIPNGSNTYVPITNYTIPAAFVNQQSCPNSWQNLKQEITIEINSQGHIVFYCKFTVNNTNCTGTLNDKYFYKSTDNGNTWTSILTPVDGHKPQQFVLNPQNSEMIYAEKFDGGGDGRCMYISDDGGAHLRPMSMGNGENHVDVRAILVFGGTQTNGSDNILYLCTDGGISKTTNGNDWVDITGLGLSITNYYGVGISETNDKIILAGAQDGSINYYNNGNWFETPPPHDNGDCLINSPGNTTVLQESQSTLQKGELNGNNYTSSFSYSPVSNWMSPLCWNPAKNNEFFVGVTKCYIGTISSPALIPIYDASLHPPKDISSVAASRHNPNVVYYSTNLFWWNQGAPDPEGIFKGTRSILGTWSVSDITNGLKTKHENGFDGLVAPITDIAVDPNDENRIWVTFGGFISDHKVFFSSDGGTNWQNISSNCLPNLPVTAIVFQEMSNDRVYIGTDNGIFYRDNIQTDWAKYGNNGPQCLVNDLEINQCAGKLVAATVGRGLWEAPLLKSPEGFTIVGVVNWNSPRTIATDLRIVSGSTLNISNTKINMGQGVKITVEPGALLQLTNDTLTNECGYVWDGIKVWGNSNLIQNGTNQGTLIINNSIIEHAIEAIEVVKPGDITKTGGIVKADNSQFLNNKRSVAYYQYLTSHNQGYFYNCIFKTDRNYRHPSSLLCHASMWAVDGIRLWGCTFETDNTWPYDVNRVQGIIAIDANFTVNAYCPGIIAPCQTSEIRSKFKGLNIGVNTSRTTGTYTYSVLESDFENNVFGIITSAHNNFNIRDCTFKVGKTNAGGAPSSHEGVVIMSGTGFNIDQNIFRPTFTSVSPNTIGIRAKDTGTEINQIYKNDFIKGSPSDQNVFYGNLANGLNRNTLFAANGLKYYCNNNVNNKKNGFDFSVTDQGISSLQGSLNYPAKNNFSWGTQLTGAPTGSDFYNGALTGAISYFHTLIGQEEPNRIFAVSKFPTNNMSNTCPDLYDDGEYDPRSAMGSEDPLTEYAQVVNEYATINHDLEESLSNRNNKIDGGNGPALLNHIQNVETDSKNELLQQLIQIAPFISLEAMEALFAKLNDPITKAEFKEIALANPDIFINNSLAKECIESEIFIEAEMSSLFHQVTDRTILENDINDLYSSKFMLCNKAISIILDNPEVFPKQEIITWLFNKNSIESDLEIVDHYINQLNFSEARMILHNLDKKYKLAFDELEELNYFIQVKELQIASKLENHSIEELTPEAMAKLEPIATNSKGLGGDQARAILNLNGYSYFIPPVFPESNNVEEQDAEIRMNTQKIAKADEDSVNKLTATPNPATSEIDFVYNLQRGTTGFIYLRDRLGNVVAKIVVQNNAGNQSWNCGNLAPGVYFYALEANDQVLTEPKRIMVIR